MNLITDKYTVQYGARLAQLDAAWGGFTVEELDASSIFVNGNDHSYKGSRAKFERSVQFDTVDDSAHPVLLYLQGEQMVGYYDLELREGYIA
jgi:hypothetical protein